MRLSIFVHGLLSLIYLYLGWWDDGLPATRPTSKQGLLHLFGMNWKFIRREVKPKNKAELVEGIKRFWLTVVATKCQKYIRHLRKVIPRIIELNGNATGYWFIVLWFCCIQSNSIHWAGTPLWCCMSVSLLQATTNRWSHVVVCTGRKQFTILKFEPCWSVVLWIDRKKYMEVWGETRNVWTHLSVGVLVCWGYLNQ